MQTTTGWRSLALAAVGLLIVVDVAAAQRAGSFQVAPRIGYVAWDNAAAIQDPVLSSGDCDFPQFNQECANATNNLMAGLSALYSFSDIFAGGVSVDVARPVSNGAYFPPASMEISGRQQLTLVHQRLTVVQYALEGQATPVGSDRRLVPFVVGSLGGVTVYKDAPKVDVAGVTGFDRFTEFMFSFGGGLDLGLTPTSSLRVEVRDVVYTGWDRDELNSVDPEFQSELFPDLMPVPPSESGTLHNIRLAIGFLFLQGGGTSPE